MGGPNSTHDHPSFAAQADIDAYIRAISRPQGPFLIRLLRAIFNKKMLVSAALGCSGALLLGGGAGTALVTTAIARLLYDRAEQSVPFSKRKRLIVLPSLLEVVMGEVLYRKFLLEQSLKGTVVDHDHKDYKLVKRISDKIIKAVTQGLGGGYQKHIGMFNWELTVLDEPVQNAFVFPGGKIVVYTGLLRLLDRQEDLVATVLGHEVAHALSRHSAEKIGMGLSLLVLAQVVLRVIARYQAQLELAPDHKVESGSSKGTQEANEEDEGEIHQAKEKEGELPSWLTEGMLQLFGKIFLELPFSRRAETEADLVGVKLMALAGYDPRRAPHTFELLAAAEKGASLGLGSIPFASIGCTHPNSINRAKLLQEEVDQMQGGGKALEQVVSNISYWAL